MINLYKSNETNFKHNEFVLSECTKCEVTEELNGTFEVDIEYPLKDTKNISKELVTGAIIKVPLGDDREPQLFVLRRPKSNLNRVSAYGQGIAITKLGNNIIKDISIVGKTRKEAISQILSNTMYNHNFVVGNKDTNREQKALKISRYSPLKAIIGKEENTILNLYGGEVIFDNFTVDIIDERGEDTGIIISHGKNLTGVSLTIDDMDLITDVIPEGNKGLFLPEYHIQSRHFNDYADPYVKVVKVSVGVVEPKTDKDGKVTNFEEVVTKEQAYEKMREAVAYMFEKQKIDQLNFNLTVNFSQLQDTEEYKNYKDLARVKQVGDIVTIKHKILGLDLKGRVFKIKKDALTSRIQEIEIGFAKKTISDVINETNKKISFTEDKINFGISNLENTMYSKFEMTKDYIQTTVTDTEQKINSTINETAFNIRTDVQNSINKTNSYFEQKSNNITASVNDLAKNTSSSINLLTNKIDSKVDEGEFGSLIKQSAKEIAVAWNKISKYVKIDDAEGLTLGDESKGTYSKVGYDGRLSLMMKGVKKPYHCLSTHRSEDVACDNPLRSGKFKGYTRFEYDLPVEFDGIDDDDITIDVSPQKVYKEGEYLRYWEGVYGAVEDSKVVLYGLSEWRKIRYETNSGGDRWVSDLSTIVHGNMVIRYTLTA